MSKDSYTLHTASNPTVYSEILNKVSHQPRTQECSFTFLAVKRREYSLMKYDICNKNFTTLVGPLQLLPKATVFSVANAVKVQNMAYMFITTSLGHYGLCANLSNPSINWDYIQWKAENYKKKFIAFKDAILAAGTPSDYNVDFNGVVNKE